MKATSLKTIYLTADELKQAIVEYLAKEHEELAQHLYDNSCSMDWKEGEYFVVSIDGEVEEALSNSGVFPETGNTTERVEEQTARVKKILEQKEIYYLDI